MRRPRTFELVPFEGALPLRLGMERTEVHDLVGQPLDRVRHVEYFYANALQIDYKRGKVVFIQVSRDTQLTVRYRGVDLFKLDADQTLKLMSADAPYDRNDPLLGRTYIFRNLGIALWRESSSEDYFDAISLAAAGYWK